MEKLLSIIVPSYNMEQYLPKCLGSLIVDDKNLLGKLDVIVVNDGSKDRTSEIAHGFEGRYPSVFRVIDKENGHYGSCINAGLKVAAGAYVKVLDADDTFDTAALAVYLRFIEDELRKGSDAADLILNDYVIVDGANRLPQSYAWCAGDGFTIAGFDFKNRRWTSMHAIAYRADVFKRFSYSQLTGITHTDVQWIFTPMAYVESLAYCPAYLYEYYEMREGNTCSPDAFYRTFHDLATVTRKLVSEYPVLCEGRTSEQKAYLWNQVRYRSCRVYHVYLLERSPLLKPGVLEEFDAFLKEVSPELYAETDKEYVGRRIKFRYIHDWRRNKHGTWRQKLWLSATKAYGAAYKAFHP